MLAQSRLGCDSGHTGNQPHAIPLSVILFITFAMAWVMHTLDCKLTRGSKNFPLSVSYCEEQTATATNTKTHTLRILIMVSGPLN